MKLNVICIKFHQKIKTRKLSYRKDDRAIGRSFMGALK